ncbi:MULTISPECIES: helix-turn-helix domain-containing protein [unclassified Streptomyces]|uniref:helix-turn-helix domain-containing protein n=1 Tax=unclassified Streptomyces TaxID=2593676 RepID=UPI0035E21682
MRPSKLPSDNELLKLEAAGLTHKQIAEEFQVSRQAVTKRFNNMDRYARQEYRDVTPLLPWDLTVHPDKDAISKHESMMGLRAFLRQRAQGTVTPRSELALRAFLAHVLAGQVLELDPRRGVQWVRRDEGRDGSLVIRWPEGVPQDERTKLFRFSPGQSEATAE